ncbi:MAG: hypothetical protein MUO43_12205 [Desulfobacterales bacterium]|nr:hypothetical protein [Desulfobacterales bacterium]
MRKALAIYVIFIIFIIFTLPSLLSAVFADDRGGEISILEDEAIRLEESEMCLIAGRGIAAACNEAGASRIILWDERMEKPCNANNGPAPLDTVRTTGVTVSVVINK